jgi:hypothetical protein
VLPPEPSRLWQAPGERVPRFYVRKPASGVPLVNALRTLPIGRPSAPCIQHAACTQRRCSLLLTNGSVLVAGGTNVHWLSLPMRKRRGFCRWCCDRQPPRHGPLRPGLFSSSVVQLGAPWPRRCAVRAHVALPPVGGCVPHLPWKLAVSQYHNGGWESNDAPLVAARRYAIRIHPHS